MPKSAMDQIHDLQTELRNSEAEEAAIREKFGKQSVTHNANKYVDDITPNASATTPAPRKRTGGIPPLESFAPMDDFKYKTNVRNKETGQMEEVEREISLVNFPRYRAILTCCAENRLATLAHLVEYMFPVKDGQLRTEAESLKLQDSIRTSNMDKLLKGDYVRKQTIGGKAAYFITKKGTHHLDDLVDAYDAASCPDTPFQIVNQATLAINLGAPNDKGLIDMDEQGTMVPGFPVLTRQRLLASAPNKFPSRRQAEDKQIAHMKAFLKSGVLPDAVPEWDRNTMTPDQAESIQRALQTPVLLPIATRFGKAKEYVDPASLFQTYDTEGSPENFVHMMIGMPNILQRDPETGKEITTNGCIAVRNELTNQSVEFYKYMLLQVFHSHAGFARFLIKSPYKSIQKDIHNTWLAMVLKGEVPLHRCGWLDVEGYKPLNASDVRFSHFSQNKGRIEMLNWATG